MMSADDELLRRAQPKGFKSAAGLTPDAPTTKKKNLSFGLRRVTPDKNDSPSSSNNKKKFGRGRRGVRSIEKEQKMQDEYYEGFNDDNDNINNHVEEEELDDGELPSLSPLANGSRFAPLSPPRGPISPASKSVRVENSPAALLVVSNNMTPTSERDYETLKVAGFWSQLDTADDDDDSDNGGVKPNANARSEEEEMPNDERQWRRSQSPPRNRAEAAAAANSNPRATSPATNSMGLSLVQNTSSDSTIKTELITRNSYGDNDKTSSGKGTAAAAAAAGGGWNLLEMARAYAAEQGLIEQEENDATESQGLDRSYKPNARVVSPNTTTTNNGRDTPFSADWTYKTGVTEYEEEEEEEEGGIIENICIQLGNICGLTGEDETTSHNKSRAHDIIAKRKQRLGSCEDDEDSVFDDLNGQEDVAIELGYVEPDVDNANAVSPKMKKKKGWKSFLGIKKKSPPRKTLVTETTRSGRDPIDGETTKVSDLNAAHTYSGDGLNPLDVHSPSATGAAALASHSYVDDDEEELESQAAGWDTKRKNEYLRQLASQAKAQQRVASISTEEDDEEEEDTTIDRQDTPEAYTADYITFNPSDKSKFLRYLNAGMTPQDATLAVIQEREALAEGEKEYVTDGPGQGPRTRSSRFPDDEEVVSVQSEDPPGVKKGESGESAEVFARDEDDLQGLVDELENQPASQSEMAHDSKNTPLEAYQDRGVIPMVPAIVRTRSKSRERHGGRGPEVEDQDGLVSSGIQYYDTVPDNRNDDEVDDEDNNLLKKQKSRIGRPRLSKPHLSSNIASNFAAKVASKRFDSSSKSNSKYGKVSGYPNSFEETNNAPPVPRVVSVSASVEEETEDREVDSAFNEYPAEDDQVSSTAKPKAISFDLMQRNKEKKFSKLESDVGFALPSVSAKSDEIYEGDLPSWAQGASRDAETVASAFSPPIENMDDEQAEENGASIGQQEADDASSPVTEIAKTEYDEDTMSLMGQTFMTGATGYSRRSRRKGVADTRVASAKEAESQAGAKSKGWIGSIQDAASKNGQVWHPEKGWVNYSEPEVDHHDNDNHGSIGRLHVPQNVSPKSLPPQAQAEVGGFTSPRSVAGTEYDDQSVFTKLTVNTAAESPSILTTSTAPTRRVGRKPRPTDQRKIAAAHADKPIGWKDSMQNAANGVNDNGGFRWDYEKGWIRIDGTSIDDDEASALTESVFYNEGQDVDRSPPKSELLPVTEEDVDEFSDDEIDVFSNDEKQRGVNTMGANEQGVSTRTVDYNEKYTVDSDDGSEKENSPANNVGVSPLLTTGSHDREDDVSDKESASVQERSNPLLGRIMASQREEVPVFSSAAEEEEEHSAEEISREPSGFRASQFISAQAHESSETESSRDPSGLQASQFNSAQEDPSGQTSAASAAPPPPQAQKRSLNTWLESSNNATPRSTNDTEASHLREASVDADKTAEGSFNLELFEEAGDVFASTHVIKEKFSDTESDLFQPFESEIEKDAFKSFESQASADNEWVSTTLKKRQSPVTTSDEVSQKARVWMDSMQKDGETEVSSESGSNEPQVNKADPPQSLDPPSANNDARIKKRSANSWIKSNNEDEEHAQKEARTLPVESKVGSLRSKFESKNDNTFEVEKENDVIFQSQAMGIRLKRGEDGCVRVVSVTQPTLGSSIDRVGAIDPGDTIKEAAGIDLRSPITNSQWGEAVTQIRHAPRPMTFVVAAGPERKSKEMSSKPVNSSAVPPSQIAGGRNVVEYNLSKTADGEQVLEKVREYRRHHSPERPGMVSPDRRKYGSPDRTKYTDSPDRSEYDSPDRTIYTEASSVYSEDLPKDSFFNRMAACATAGAAACAPGGAQRSSDDGEKSQVPMAHLQFLRTNPTITRVTNAAKNRYPTLCGRPDTIFEEPDGGPTYDLGRSKSGATWTSDGWPATTDDGSRVDVQSRASSSARVVQGKNTGDNTVFLENLAMKSAVSSNPSRPNTEGASSPKPTLMAQSHLSAGGEVGWPEDNQDVTWQKDTIDNVSTFSAHSAQKKETARQAEMLAAAKVEAMMEDLDHDEDSECEI